MAVATAPPSSEPRRGGPLETGRLREAFFDRVRTVGRFAAAVALVALARACLAGPPPPKSLDGLCKALGEAAHVVVHPNDFVWEASDGVSSDLANGRRILFLGADREGAPRDLFRARVRLSPEGRPLEVRDVVNLTATPYGDEQGLVRDATAERAAFATFAYGQLQGLTVLDLRGEARAAKATSAGERAMLWVTNVQETGDGAGIARLQVALEKETTAAALRFDGPTLVAQLAQANGGTRLAKIDVDKADLVEPVEGVRVELLARVPKKPIHWAVDTVRAVPWIGPEPIAWLEAKVWEAKDRLKRFRYGLVTTDRAADEVKVDVDKIAPRPLDPTAAGEDGGYWPPQPVPTIYKNPEPGEGEWIAHQPEWMHRLPGAPSPFYRTFVRPDPLRPYSKIILVAMDTRQLDFDMEAGVDDPKPTVGSFHGTGRIPRDPSIAGRTVAAFNGGFKTEHGHYGMMLKKRVLLPPVPTAATAAVTEDGRFVLGAWQPSREIPVDVVSYRQNMDPLIDDGVFNPRGRGAWGAVLPNQKNLVGQQTERSGICLTKAHHVLYVWGDDVGPDALGKAMQLADCDFGIHLDMNPYHTGFVFMSFHDTKFQNGKSETLTPLMAIGPRRYIDYNPKDFFFVTLREPAPKTGTIAWQPDEGVHPPPKWLPGIFRAQAESVALLAFDPGRVRWTVRAGSGEKLDRALAREIDGDDGKRVVAAIGLGIADPKRPGGITVGRAMGHAPISAEPTLVVAEGGALSILEPGAQMPPGAVDLVQGPSLIEAGRIVEGHRSAPKGLRVAVGITKEGRVIVARGKSETDEPLAQALLEAGCVRAIAARGTQDGFVSRAGGADAPMSSYAQTTLYAIAQPMLPRAGRLDRAPGGKPLWPVATQPVP
jgi:hypothetical protein